MAVGLPPSTPRTFLNKFYKFVFRCHLYRLPLKFACLMFDGVKAIAKIVSKKAEEQFSDRCIAIALHRL